HVIVVQVDNERVPRNLPRAGEATRGYTIDRVTVKHVELKVRNQHVVLQSKELEGGLGLGHLGADDLRALVRAELLDRVGRGQSNAVLAKKPKVLIVAARVSEAKSRSVVTLNGANPNLVLIATVDVNLVSVKSHLQSPL